ncbi:hypothetical protein ACXO9Y_05025, partial [Lactobacillus delbrueckii subsp. bulgaricus]
IMLLAFYRQGPALNSDMYFNIFRFLSLTDKLIFPLLITCGASTPITNRRRQANYFVVASLSFITSHLISKKRSPLGRVFYFPGNFSANSVIIWLADFLEGGLNNE